MEDRRRDRGPQEFKLHQIAGDMVDLKKLFKELVDNKESLLEVIITEGRHMKKISFLLDNPSQNTEDKIPKTFEL